MKTLGLYSEGGFQMKIGNIDKDSIQILNSSAEKLLAIVIDQYKMSIMGTLVKGIVHNLNGALQILSMRMELLQRLIVREKGEITPGFREQMEQCLGQIDQFRNLIGVLMKKAAQDELEGPQLIQVNDVLEECLALLHHNIFFKHQVKVNKKYSSSLPPLKASYPDLSLGIWNVLQNAIEAMENSPSKMLTVATGTDGSQIRVTVQDTGCGIPEEIQNRIFEPFFSTKKGKHPGMGLFLTQKLLQPYGTNYEILSGEGETVFTIYLPTSAGRGN